MTTHTSHTSRTTSKTQLANEKYHTTISWLKQHRNVRQLLGYSANGCFIHTTDGRSFHLRVHMGELQVNANGKTTSGYGAVKTRLLGLLR